MTATEKTRLQERLLAQREQIVRLTNSRDGRRHGDDGVQDFCDLAAADIDSDIADQIEDNASDLLDSIDLALERLADGTYGVCENCQKKIPAERLRARPVASRCVPCQTEEEKREAAMRPRRRDESSF